MSPQFLLRPILAGALLCSFSAPRAQAQNTPLTVTVDGKPVDFGGAAPTQVGGRTLVPLRAIFEALGAQVDFSNGAIRARRGDTNLSLALGSTSAIVNGVTRALDVPAQSVFGRTLVPLRFVGEALGAGVNFNPITNLISITSPGGASGGATGGASGVGNSQNEPYTVPGANVTASGTLVKIDLTAPATVTISQNGAFKTYAMSENPLALRQISLSSSTSATPVRQAARQISLSNISPGDSVRLSLDNTGRATQITSTATVLAARVQFAGQDQIVLDDERDTTLTLGPNLRFIDARGRVSSDASSLTAGQSIGLFISRDTKAIYQVSAFAPDFTASAPGGATGTSDPLTGTTTLPTAGTPQIQLVTHSAKAPLRAGQRLDVSVRATPGLRASFSLGTRVQNVALTENPEKPGTYSGSYTVKAGDDVLEGRVSVRVLTATGAEFLAQGETPVTLDTVAPRLVGTFPASGAQIAVAQPNIAIFADDLGGSGLARANLTLTQGDSINAVAIPLTATVAPPTSVNAVAPQELSGPVTVKGRIFDKAGNGLSVNFGFTVADAGAGDISSFSHGASRALGAGDDVPLVLLAPPAGRASFDVISAAKTIARDVPLVEVEEGKYRATYRVPASAIGNLRFIGKFAGGDGQTSQLEATTKVQIAGLPTKLTISTPTEGDKVTSPLAVRGQASPGATIDVSLRAEGTQFFILEYKQELGVQQVRADANGNWTVSLELPALRNVSGLKFTISATQTDAAEKTSEPVEVTVTR